MALPALGLLSFPSRGAEVSVGTALGRADRAAAPGLCWPAKNIILLLPPAWLPGW